MLKDVVLTNSDWYLDDIFDFLKDLKITTIINKINRYAVDVNRSIEDTNFKNYKSSIVFQRTTQGFEIYKEALSNEEIEDRVKRYYLPYHEKLNSLIDKKLEKFNKVFLLDLHSFGLDEGDEIILGDNFSKSMKEENQKMILDEYRKQGFSVGENKPFSGGYITKHYED